MNITYCRVAAAWTTGHHIARLGGSSVGQVRFIGHFLPNLARGPENKISIRPVLVSISRGARQMGLPLEWTDLLATVDHAL